MVVSNFDYQHSGEVLANNNSNWHRPTGVVIPTCRSPELWRRARLRPIGSSREYFRLNTPLSVRLDLKSRLIAAIVR